MILWVLRAVFGILMFGIGISVLVQYSEASEPWTGVIYALAVLAVGGLVVVGDWRLREKPITVISAIYCGLLMGLLLGSVFSSALEPLLDYWLPVPALRASTHFLLGKQFVRLMITIVCCYLSVSVLLQTKDEFRFIIPYVEFSKQLKGARPLVLDTSVIIDGRIADICETRIVDSKLVVPRFVLQELQAIADSGDKLKRNRGRRGLDILKKMQANPKIELQLHDAGQPELRDVLRVDERLVVFTKAVGGRVMTNDYNLNKIAQLQGVEVINLNEVANSLKTVALPGEAMTIRLVKPGDQMGQGVGYLEDGTMVVVEGGRQHVGTEVTLTVTSVLQTPAGRMIFGRLDIKPGTTGSSAEMPKFVAPTAST
ncbi:MAG: PIN/TRAM domain-containing protein [Gemmataceae bacterium]|nr:PIN/TRAM domain-containing protein [Gemmataceae bacterium]